MKKVVFIKRVLPHYRVSFYEGLKLEFKKHNIDLYLLYGRNKKENYYFNSKVSKLSWAKLIDVRYIKIGRAHLIYQSCLRFIKDADLIVVDQWNSLLINYYLMLRRLLKLSKTKLAFWGHGLNRQTYPHSWRNIFKRIFINQVDWWFVYTRGVGEIIERFGFPKEKTTILQNAIDTKELIELQRTITGDEINRAKISLKLKNGPVAIFCGGMYKEKRISFLIKACLQIKDKIPDFQMIFIGDGPHKAMIVELSEKKDWVHWLKPVWGKGKIIYFSLADLLLMPGLVGLVVLDTFVTETPIVTTNYKFHSPEMEYIKNGKNGIITENEIEVYVDKVVNLLNNKAKIEKLKEGCKVSAKEYTIERMIENFTKGVIECFS